MVCGGRGLAISQNYVPPSIAKSIFWFQRYFMELASMYTYPLSLSSFPALFFFLIWGKLGTLEGKLPLTG